MELNDISGNIIYGGKDDTIKLLEEIAEAIQKGGISIDDVTLLDSTDEDEKGNNWNKISFWYKFENKKGNIIK